MGRFANAENLLTQCERFYLSPDDARNIIDRMEAIIRDNWYAIARREEVTARDCDKISTAFTYPGFRLGAAA
jgi:serine/threonine-protein kinase HipA